METTAVEVEYRYASDQLQVLFELARAEDVEKGGRYDARSGAINIYTHPWQTWPEPPGSSSLLVMPFDRTR